jgi:hypothetical protein
MEPADLKFFDHLEARWEDEKGYEEFTDYTNACRNRFGERFLKLQQDPFSLFLKGETYSIQDGKIYYEKE